MKLCINMNELDKSFYKALKFLANNTRAEITVMNEQELEDYEENVPATKENPVEQTLINFGYLQKTGDTKWMITQSGLQQLRDLEHIRHKDLIIYSSSAALIISILSFAVAQGWIKF